jgi:transposase-like protein
MRTLKPSNRSISENKDFIPQDFYDIFWSDTELKMKELLRETLQTALSREAGEYVKREWYERGGENIIYRNGTRKRKSLISHLFGAIQDFEIPRFRNAIFQSKILVRYCRRTREFENAVLTMYINGQSCRRVKKTLKKLFRLDLSAASISAILQAAQNKLDEWRKKPIDREYKALLLDGVHINLRVGLKALKPRANMKENTSSGVVIVVMGIRKDGSKEILSFKICAGESKDECNAILTDLYNRGLRLEPGAPIIHDGSEGLSAGATEAFPFNPHQLCVFHFIQGIKKLADNDEQAEKIQQELSEIYKLHIKQKDAVRAFENMVKRLWKVNLKIACYINRHFILTLTYLTYERSLHESFKTTNYLERSFREINRKVYDVGVFPNLRSAERIIFLQIIELNSKETGELAYYA